ncbi:MAG: 16S rRNA methyltransferase, partial [Chloroflexi bacterium]|nr:16S rRNA methyltransferase [Chloroflexota bacterium]
MSQPDDLDELVAAVQAGAHYRAIDTGLVRRLGAQELAKGRPFKAAVKATRNKLHQVGGAYQEGGIDYPRGLARLESLPGNLGDPGLRTFCQEMMQQHASTRERLPYLEDFYAAVFDGLPPVSSLLDLACGLNPLARPWMPLAPQAVYTACDIYTDLAAFLNRFFAHSGQPGSAGVCDLTRQVPQAAVQVALLLKTIPCLEQVDKDIAARLLDGIAANVLVVSFPARSLGGRSKGMLQNYAAHFMDLLAGREW